MPRQSCGPEVVRRQVVIEAFRLSPDGSQVVYLRRHVDGNAYRTHLWRVRFAGGGAQQLTRGAVRDSSPTFSPDGSRLAFIRTAEGADHGQVWLLPLAGGEPWQLTTLPHGASSVSWSPDGSLLAVLAPSSDVPFVQGPLEARTAPRVRRITRLDWRDGEGHRDRYTHLFLVQPRPKARPRQLTSGDYSVSHAAWSPDSAAIAFTSDRGARRDVAPRSTIWKVELAGGEPRELVGLRGDADRAAFSPDGSLVAFLGTDVVDPADYAIWQVWIVPAVGGRPRAVSPSDLPAGTWSWSDLDLAEERPGPVWLEHGSVAWLASARARCHPYRAAIDGGTAERMCDEDRLVASGLAQAGTGSS